MLFILCAGEDDLKDALSADERAAAVRLLPGSHDGKVERLCCRFGQVQSTCAVSSGQEVPSFYYAWPDRDAPLCCSRDNVAATLVELLRAPNTAGKSITLIDGVRPVQEAIAAI